MVDVPQVELASSGPCVRVAALKSLVRAGAGIGIVYRDTVTEELRTGKLKAIKFPIDLTVDQRIVYSRERPLTPLAGEFLRLLRSLRRCRSAAGRH
ncbi:MAG: hypothetical protein FJ145_15600 [Deltaproteobacteria bacterium]|nr:hypothetical protein [Deltaproteobacteria bacterium]